MGSEIYCSSPWLPVEWIAAHGFAPCGVWSAASALTGATPQGVCAFARQVEEFSRAQPHAAVIFTTGCDQMRRAADAAARRHPRTFLFNLPATWQTAAARRLYHSEVGRLGRFLESLGGSPPTAAELEAAVLDWDLRRARLRSLLPQTGARLAAELLMAFFHDGSVPGMAQIAKGDGQQQPSGRGQRAPGTEEPGARGRTVPPPPAASKGLPLALVGGPLLRSQLELFDAIASVGGQVVLNATEPGERCLLPPLPPQSQSLLAALADHYFDHAVDVFHRPNSRLYAWLGPRLAQRRARGIVLWVHVGCDLWRAEAASLREACDLPVLVLDEHEAQAVGPRGLTRLCAFVESLS